MKNKVKEGKSISHTAASDIVSGAPVVIGNRVGIAVQDISTGKTGEIEMEGVFELPADNTTAFSQGDELFHDGTELTKAAADATLVGICETDKASAGTTARVRIGDGTRQAAKVADASVGDAAEINALRDALIAAGLMSNT